jgi:hypothetical protein
MRAKPGPVAKLLPSAHAVEREFAVMRGLPARTSRCRAMYCLCEDESVIGRAFYVMEFMQGRVLWDQSLPGMTRAERGAIYDEMNRVIARCTRSTSPSAAWPATASRATTSSARSAAGPSSTRPRPTEPADPAMEKLIEWLPRTSRGGARHQGVHRARRLPPRQHDVPPDRAAHPRRAGLGAVDAGPSAGRLQLPLHELAHPARQFRGIGGLDLAALGIPSEDATSRRYCERTGLTTSPT